MDLPVISWLNVSVVLICLSRSLANETHSRRHLSDGDSPTLRDLGSGTGGCPTLEVAAKIAGAVVAAVVTAAFTVTIAVLVSIAL